MPVVLNVSSVVLVDLKVLAVDLVVVKDVHLVLDVMVTGTALGKIHTVNVQSKFDNLAFQ
jgi:hypothetical protein